MMTQTNVSSPPWRSVVWWLVLLTAMITPINFGKIGLLSSGGPDLIKWGIRAPLWYLPLAILIPRWSGLLRAAQTPPSSWLILWSLLGTASVTWAVAPDQAVLLGLANLGLVGLGTWYGYERGWESFAAAAATGLLATVGIGLLMDVTNGLLGAGRSEGLTSGPTTQGRLACYGLVLVGGLIHRRAAWRSLWLVAAGVFAVSLWFSGTRTAMGAAALGLLYGGLSKLPPLYRRLALVGAIVVGVALITALGSSGGAVAELSERNDPTSFSGRTEVWPTVIEFVKDKPVLGYGVGAEGILFEIALNRGDIPFLAGTSHNMYLTTWLAGGVVGFLLFVAALLSAFRHRHRVDPWVFALVPVIAVSGITESIIDIPSTTLLLLAGCLAVGTRNRWRRGGGRSGLRGTRRGPTTGARNHSLGRRTGTAAVRAQRTGI